MVHQDNIDKAVKYGDIADLLPGEENYRIKARVLRMWKVPAFLNPSECSSIEMVLVDKKGAKIHASVRKQLIHKFESKIEEGQVYDMSMFTIFPESGSYWPTLHSYKIVFMFKTKIELSDSCDEITEYGLHLSDIGEVCAYNHDYEYLVDVIGYLTGISAEREYVRDGKLTKMVVVELTDHSGKVECALFGQYADDMVKKMGKLSGGLPIVVIQFAKIKIFREKASLQNVHNTTRVWFNPNIPEVETFKNSVAVHGIECDATVPLLGQPAKPPMEEEFLRLHPKRTIDDIINSHEDGIFTVSAKVVGLVDGADWWYLACKCHKAVIPESGSYFCTACDKHVFNVVPRFRVKLEVAHNKSSVIFVLFDSEMSYIMEKSCPYFVSQSKARNAGAHPIEFESLFGKTYLFVVDKSPRQSLTNDSSFRVKRVCMDPKVIDRFFADGPYSIKSEPVSPPIIVESGSESETSDAGDDEETVEFLKDLIVTPTDVVDPVEEASSVGGRHKRKLSKSVGVLRKRKGNRRYKQLNSDDE